MFKLFWIWQGLSFKSVDYNFFLISALVICGLKTLVMCVNNGQYGSFLVTVKICMMTRHRLLGDMFVYLLDQYCSGGLSCLVTVICSILTGYVSNLSLHWNGHGKRT